MFCADDVVVSRGCVGISESMPLILCPIKENHQAEYFPRQLAFFRRVTRLCVNPMKRFLLLCMMASLLAGCAITRRHRDNFASLREEVARRLAADCDCGPVKRVEGQRSFELLPHNPIHHRILVFEREFLTQKEWNERQIEQRKTVDYITKNIDTATREEVITAASTITKPLPGFWHGNIAIDVFVDMPEYSYPESEKEGREADKITTKIEALLHPYKTAEQSRQ